MKIEPRSFLDEVIECLWPCREGCEDDAERYWREQQEQAAVDEIWQAQIAEEQAAAERAAEEADRNMPWDEKTAVKIERVLNAFPGAWRISPGALPRDSTRCVVDVPATFLPENELRITETPPMATLTNINSGVWSCEDVVYIYCHRAAICY